ncbi:MAG: AMP-binding protein, partial [Dehalococcoidia bacterium]|nr:AMP-binding protein [Dehalococcoidia bacterium]
MSDAVFARDWTEVVPFGDLPVRAAARYPDADAVIFPDRRHTYASLNEAAVRAARSLAGLGLGPGDHLGILMPNCMDYIEIMLGAAMLGAWVVPINARYKEHELAYVIENADLTLLVTSDLIDEHVDFVELLHRCLPGLAEAPDPAALDLPAAPKLRSVILIG